MNLKEKIFCAGVVGAGGGGFPTHIKADSEVEFLIANGAECEPLLHKDYELMLNFPSEIIKGMGLMAGCVSAKRSIIGIKAKNHKAIDSIKKIGSGIEICELEDVYPSGDEYELVYSATGRLIPPGGIPINTGCVVNNVETLYNISLAAEGIPVTEKMLTVTGAVKNPLTCFAPIGTSFEELIKFAGGTTVADYYIFISGVMMGSLTKEIKTPVTKTTGGIIILPAEHYLVKRRTRTMDSMRRIGKSACDQCSHCTELCPRYLLGYDVQPHKVMRSLAFSSSGKELWNKYARYCSSCGLCTYYSCPEHLYPREACDIAKSDIRESGITYEKISSVNVHPIKNGRMTHLNQLMKRLNLEEYNSPTPFTPTRPLVSEVKIMLRQNAGVKAVPVIGSGERVEKGSLLAKAAEGKLSANIHSSITGVVRGISEDFITICS